MRSARYRWRTVFTKGSCEQGIASKDGPTMASHSSARDPVRFNGPPGRGPLVELGTLVCECFGILAVNNVQAHTSWMLQLLLECKKY